MIFERPRSRGSFAEGPPTTLGEVYDEAVQSARYVDNVNARWRGLEEAYDARIDAVHGATGVRLENPYRSRVGSVGAPGLEQDTGDPFAFFDAELARLAEARPEHREAIAPHRPVAGDAAQRARAVDERLTSVLSRSDAGAVATTGAMLLGGLRGSLEDPVNLLSMALGPAGGAGAGWRGVLWAGAKAGAANAAVETALQPLIQDWRRQAGLDYGLSQAALNITAAGVLGFGLDAGIRGLYRGGQAAAGRVPVLDKGGRVTGYRPAGASGEAAGGQSASGAGTLPADPAAALDAAARAAPDGSALRRAADGDAVALDELVAASGAAEDPAMRGARLSRDMGEADLQPVDGVDPADGIDRLIAALRAADDPDAHPPPRPADVVPEARGAALSDAAPPPAALGRAFEKDGKPVVFRAFDPASLTADPQTFQFRRQVNKAGVTGRMSGIERWDPMASGKVVVFERQSGELVIADGHHRLELARRLADQKPELQGYLFRERDGWTTADVRAYAAKKNMMDSPRVDPIDAASALRERPDLIDKSVAVGDEAMRQARALAKLSDDAFGMAVNGVLPPNMAALIGDLVPDKSRHASIMAELAGLEPANVREARFALAELMALPVHAEEQMSLLGALRFERSLMKERMAVLDASLKALREDSRIFGLLDREAGRIAEAGNRLAGEANALRADQAAQLGQIIERLAVSRGPVSDWLNEAAQAVASSHFSKRQAAQLFAKRVGDAYERDGLAGLTAPEIRGDRIDEPGGPDAQAQVARLEADLAREIEAVRKPDAARSREEARQQAVLFDASRPFARTERAAEQWDEIRAHIVDTVKMLPRDVQLRVQERLVYDDGREVSGLWDGFERVVYVSMSAPDPVRTARHEVIHALRQSGLLSDREFDTLYAFAERLGLRQAYDIDALYGDLYRKAYGDLGDDYVEALLREETIANMFSDYAANGRRFGELDGGGVIDQVIGEIVAFLKEIRDFLWRRGFQDVNDIFRAIESGEVARRYDAPAGPSGSRLASIEGGGAGELPWGGKRHLVDDDIYTAADAIQRLARGEISLPMAQELEIAANRVRSGEADLLAAAFGSAEKARRWQYLWRQAEHEGNGPMADRADAERAALEADVIDKTVFDGIELADEPNLRDLASVFRDIENNPHEIPDILPRHLGQLPLSEKSPMAWTLPEAKAVAIMRKAGFEMEVNDIDAKEVTKRLVDRYRDYFSDPADAAFMLEALRASIVPRATLRAQLTAADRAGDVLGVVENCKL